MRFRKLKIFVAVFLLIFILATANIIGFGYLQNKDAQSTLAIQADIRKNTSVIQTNLINQASANQSQPLPEKTSTVIQPQAQSNPVVAAGNSLTIVPHPTVNTRAS